MRASATVRAGMDVTRKSDGVRGTVVEVTRGVSSRTFDLATTLVAIKMADSDTPVRGDVAWLRRMTRNVWSRS